MAVDGEAVFHGCLRPGFLYILDGGGKAAAFVSSERDDGLAREVVILEEGEHHLRIGTPPDGTADKNDIVRRHVYIAFVGRQFFQRIRAPRTLFGEEIVGSLLAILLYDMWNIYSREIEKAEIEDITSRHFLRFLMSVQEHCRAQREVAWYARELGLAPKYLSEISKSITGRPAGDWIDSYSAHELQKLLSDQHLTLTDIVDAMHFSSQPALTRYMKRVMNTTPSEFRQFRRVARQHT